MRLLVVEDDPDLAEVLRRGLEEDGHAVDLSTDGEDGLWRATTVDYDVAVLDITLPKVDGLEIVRRMRQKGKSTPVLFLTARDTVDDRVTGLDLGADDYLVKPFAWNELFARVRALLRRGASGSSGVLTHFDVELDPRRHEVRRAGESVDLTAMEFQLLYLLMRHPGRVFSRTQLCETIYNDDHEGMSNTVEVFVSRLRKKLARPGAAQLVKTVRGVGYVLADSDVA